MGLADRVPWPVTPALAAALADLEAATTHPWDAAAAARWSAHRAACAAEGLCPLTGQPLTTCRDHYHHRDGSISVPPWSTL